MSGAAAKAEARRLLDSPEAAFDLKQALAGLRVHPVQPVIRALLAGLSRAQAQTRWRAVALLGPIVAGLAAADPEAGREVVRRLRWSLNEESGAMGWGAAEAYGEILHHSPLLAAEFAALFISYLAPCANRLEHPALLAGAVWGLGRLAEARPDLAGQCDAGERLAELLDHPDPEVAGRAAWALGRLGVGLARPRLKMMTTDPRRACFPRGGRLGSASLGALAKEALAGLPSKSA
ncbi:MAG: DVU0298 family protein [Thermodesulfobacteriota bacterium]